MMSSSRLFTLPQKRYIMLRHRIRQSRKRNADLQRADVNRKRVLFQKSPLSKLIEGGGDDER